MKDGILGIKNKVDVLEKSDEDKEKRLENYEWNMQEH
jgi:hypothetical protein